MNIRSIFVIMDTVFLTCGEQLDIELWPVFFYLLQYNENPTELLNNLIVVCLLGVMIVTGNRIAINPQFTRIPRFLENF